MSLPSQQYEIATAVNPANVALKQTARMRCFSIVSLIAVLCLSIIQPIQAHDDHNKVVVQLRGDHQFQFAGFYAALWQGFYADEGLTVHFADFLDEEGQVRNSLEEVSSGRAQFGVGATDVLIARDNGIPVQIIASIFQQSSIAIFARRSSAITSLADLTKMKVYHGQDDLFDTILYATLRNEGINPDLLTAPATRNKPLPFELLAKGQIDAYTDYGLTAIWLAEHQNVPISIIKPSTYGVDFYGDSIFTAESFAKENPALVDRFRRATIKGWSYALAHADEIAERITVELPRSFAYDDLLAFNQFQAEAVRELMHYPQVAIGNVNPKRWESIHATLRMDGLVKRDFDPRVIYDPDLDPMFQLSELERTVQIGGIIAATLLALSVIAFYAMGINASRSSRHYDQMLMLHQKKEKHLALYEKVFHQSSESHVITDEKNQIIDVNQSYLDMVGYERHEVLGRNPKFTASGHTKTDLYNTMLKNLNTDGVWEGELWDRNKAGETFPKRATMTLVRNEQGEPLHHLASYTDISEQKATEERINYLFHNDQLTGLPNRFTLERRLDQFIEERAQTGTQAALLFIDMDRFKQINDSLGHRIGDRLIKEISHRLRKCVRNSDVVARSGGDDFIILLREVNNTEYVSSVAQLIVDRLSDVYTVENHLLYSSPSIGISCYPDDGLDSEVLMRAADTAMYRAKQAGGKQFKYFSAEMTLAVAQSLVLESGLQAAINNNQLRLFYQPQIAVKDGAIRGFEALIRWQHPEFGLIYPDEFIPAAEKNGLIHQIGRWQMNEACRQLKQWQSDRHQPGIVMSVNISRHQLCSIRFVTEVMELIALYDIPPETLELEITETAAMEDAELAISHMLKLRDVGVSLAIDDFGTGYSSLAYLKRFPIHVLKLDREFVQDINADGADEAIIKGTLALAHSLGLELIAEGVETPAQRKFLAEQNCDYIQGYLYGKPAEAVNWESRIQQFDDAEVG